MTSKFNYSNNLKHKIRIILLVAFVVIISLVIFGLSIGGVYIPYYSGSQYYYDVSINDYQASTFTIFSDVKLINNLLYLVPVECSNLFWSNDSLDGYDIPLEDIDKIKINTYACYYDDILFECNPYRDLEKKEVKRIKYNMKIYYPKKSGYELEEYPSSIDDIDENYNLIYKGKIDSSIRPYITEVGQYLIVIDAKRGFTTQEVMFVIYNDGNVVKVI